MGRFEDAAVTLAQVSVLAPGAALVDLRIRGGFPGLAVIPRLQATLPKLGLVALGPSPGYRRAALADGADEFVDKAAFDTALLPAMRRAAGAAARRQQDLRPTSGGAEAALCPR